MILSDLTVSLLRFCKGVDEDLQFVNFDASADEEMLPRADVIGPLGLTFELDDQLIDGSFQIGISTFNDKNNFRLTRKLDHLLEKLQPLNKLAVYNADTGQVEGWMIIQSPVRVMPVVGGKSRNLQFIAVNFLTNLGYQPQP